MTFTPPVEWELSATGTYIVHLGSTKFCIVRFFNDNQLSSTYPVTHAGFTDVEVYDKLTIQMEACAW